MTTADPRIATVRGSSVHSFGRMWLLGVLMLAGLSGAAYPAGAADDPVGNPPHHDSSIGETAGMPQASTPPLVPPANLNIFSRYLFFRRDGTPLLPQQLTAAQALVTVCYSQQNLRSKQTVPVIVTSRPFAFSPNLLKTIRALTPQTTANFYKESAGVQACLEDRLAASGAADTLHDVRYAAVFTHYVTVPPPPEAGVVVMVGASIAPPQGAGRRPGEVLVGFEAFHTDKTPLLPAQLSAANAMRDACITLGNLSTASKYNGGAFMDRTSAPYGNLERIQTCLDDELKSLPGVQYRMIFVHY